MTSRICCAVVALAALGMAACSPNEEIAKAADAGKKADKKPVKPVEQPKNPWADLKPTVLGQHGSAATHVAFSSDGSLLVSTGKDKLIKIWDVSSGALVKTLSGHTGDVAMADFSADGKWVVSASADETVKVWELATGKAKQTFKEAPPPKNLTDEEQQALAAVPKALMNWAAFSPDGKQVITASDDFALKLWDITTGKKVKEFRDDGCRQRSVFRRRDGAGWLSAAGCMDDGVTYLRFWDEGGTLVQSAGDEQKDAHYLAFDKANQFIVAGDGSMSMAVFSSQGSFLKRAVVGAYHFCLAFGPDDKTLLIGTDGGEIFVFRPVTWAREGKLDVGEKVAVDWMALSPRDGSLAVALRNGKILRFATPVR